MEPGRLDQSLSCRFWEVATHPYEEIPGPLKLEELPKDAWTRIWNLFFLHLRKSNPQTSVAALGGFAGRPSADARAVIPACAAGA